MVVISIISLLSSVVLSAVNSARVKGDNTARIRAVQEYKKAFDLSYDKDGAWPTAVLNANGICLGDYTTNQCTHYATTFFEDSTVSTAIERYLKFRAPFKPLSILGGTYDGPFYGYIGGFMGVCNTSYPCAYYIEWHLSGSVDCGYGITFSGWAPDTEPGSRQAGGGLTQCFLFLK